MQPKITHEAEIIYAKLELYAGEHGESEVRFTIVCPSRGAAKRVFDGLDEQLKTGIVHLGLNVPLVISGGVQGGVLQ